MRPYFYKQATPTQDRRNESFRNRQRETERSRRPRKSIALKVRDFIVSLIPRRLTAADRWYIAMAAEKRARRRARNIMWWARDLTRLEQSGGWGDSQ